MKEFLRKPQKVGVAVGASGGISGRIQKKNPVDLLQEDFFEEPEKLPETRRLPKDSIVKFPEKFWKQYIGKILSGTIFGGTLAEIILKEFLEESSKNFLLTL